MCGICGYIDNQTLSREIGMKMVMQMKHRGPDCQDVKIYPECDCLLGHARLSIIDLSNGANQPLEYKHYTIVFNGEIYNFREIKRELEEKGHQFLLDSDTEVIIHAYEEWGKSCVQRFIGMFAFAILNRKEKRLILCRDRAGIKPLYYYEHNGTFMFASELKVFYPHPHFKKELDSNAIALYFKYGYIQAPYAIFQHSYKLEPAQILEYDIQKRTYQIERYWDVLEYYRKPKLSIGYEEAKEQLESLLKSAFNYRMVADVPVGIFLSGGYDSVGVTAMLQRDRTDKLRTFTIGFPIGNNEAPIAKEIAQYLGTEHTEYICTPEDCMQIIPELPKYFDEPFSDNSAVPTILVSRVAQQDVKVALSADAGDETFAGYNSYSSLLSVINYLKVSKYFKGNTISNLFKVISNITSNPYSFYREKSETYGKLIAYPIHERTAVAFEYAGSLMESVFKKIIRLNYPHHLFTLDERLYYDPISVAMAIDYQNYMPNDILVKVDRATMSTSLEGREPILDHRIIEFASTLPTEYKICGNTKKRIFKDIIHQYVPQKIMDRPKTGFTMPIESWLKGDLRFLLEQYIDKGNLNQEFFHVEQVLQIKEDFLNNRLGHEEKIIWRLLEFLLWKEEHLKA